MTGRPEKYAIVSATAYSVGDGGSIHLTANAISLDGDGAFSGLLTQTGRDSKGNGGSLFIYARSIEIRGGSQISATALGIGMSGAASEGVSVPSSRSTLATR